MGCDIIEKARICRSHGEPEGYPTIIVPLVLVEKLTHKLSPPPPKTSSTPYGPL